MDQVDFAGLFSDLVRFETELWEIVDKHLRDVHDLPLSRFEPMQVIERTPRCRVIDIAEALAITVGGTSKLVDRIEGAGLCQRLPDPMDGRSSLLELTPSGKQLLADATITFRDILENRIGSSLPSQSLQDFAVTIRLLRQHLRANQGLWP